MEPEDQGGGGGQVGIVYRDVVPVVEQDEHHLAVLELDLEHVVVPRGILHVVSYRHGSDFEPRPLV
ncbi:MAG: hypothetical protein K6G78_06160 [bacterium]|nr:hypothetical protein [bacterium]